VVAARVAGAAAAAVVVLAVGSSAGAAGRPGAASRPGAPGRAGSAIGTRATSSTSTDWTVYHRYASGSGQGPVTLNLEHLKVAWTSPLLDGTLYGEPLVWGDGVYVATENDTVYELSASRGTIVWSHHLGPPVPSSDLPCTNISPTNGVTGTPVIDTSRNEIFLVANELIDKTPHHILYGLGTAHGTIELTQRVDPPGAYTPAILQRVSLTLDGDRVVFGFGGNWGDCSTYHGWVESVPVTGGKAYFFKVDPRKGDDQGAIWMGGAAPIVNSNGDVWVAAGNGSVNSASQPYDYSDSVLELSPTLKLLQFFAPSTWASDNGSDLDLGSSVPAVLPNGLVIQAGKSENAYLLNAAKLGGIGHELEELKGICGNVVDGGVAFSGSTAYLPCESGIMAVATDAKTRRMHQLWQTSTGAGGPPILADGYVWTLSGGTLYALSRKTGDAVQEVSVGGAATDFPTPSVGDGLLLAPSSNQVHAFRGT